MTSRTADHAAPTRPGGGAQPGILSALVFEFCVNQLAAIRASEQAERFVCKVGDCDSAIDPDEDNSGLEPAVEVCLTCGRPCSEICMWDSDECMACKENRTPQRRGNGQIVGGVEC